MLPRFCTHHALPPRSLPLPFLPAFLPSSPHPPLPPTFRSHPSHRPWPHRIAGRGPYRAAAAWLNRDAPRAHLCNEVILRVSSDGCPRDRGRCPPSGAQIQDAQPSPPAKPTRPGSNGSRERPATPPGTTCARACRRVLNAASLCSLRDGAPASVLSASVHSRRILEPSLPSPLSHSHSPWSISSTSPSPS